ncbi:MAG: four-carbon acid sugar kinase family protein [Desulfurococcaceae archaeon]
MKVFRSVLIIADDFTGANDTAAQFSKLGFRTISTLNPNLIDEYLRNYSVVAIDTESRTDEASEAYRKLYKVGLRIKQYDDILLYKKIDSTLRGNVTEEIRGLFDSVQPDLVIFAPAYPKQGRTTIRGVHLVNGVPVDQTFFGRDPRTPVKSSYIPSFFSNVFGKSYTHVFLEDLRSGEFRNRLNTYKVISFDVENEKDLMTIVESLTEFDGKVLWVGSAGLSETLAYNVIIGSLAGKPTLIVVGSLNDVTRRQLARFIGKFSCKLIKLSIKSLLTNFEEEYSRTMSQVAEALKIGIDVVVTTSYDSTQVDEGKAVASEMGLSSSELGARIADGLGKMASGIVRKFGTEVFSGIFVTGGDTALSLIKNMNIDSLEVVGEVEPGVPLLRSGDLYIVTKAGGFGKDSTIIRIVARLKGESRRVAS